MKSTKSSPQYTVSYDAGFMQQSKVNGIELQKLKVAGFNDGQEPKRSGIVLVSIVCMKI